jgi:hypothetical protein
MIVPLDVTTSFPFVRAINVGNVVALNNEVDAAVSVPRDGWVGVLREVAATAWATQNCREIVAVPPNENPKALDRDDKPVIANPLS